MSNDSAVLHVSDADFEREVLKSEKMVLVDFWAEWCPPCRAIAPMLEEVAKEKSDVVRIAKVNVENDEKLAAQFFITNIPTLIFFKNGKPVDQFAGAVSKKVMLEKIEAALAK